MRLGIAAVALGLVLAAHSASGQPLVTVSGQPHEDKYVIQITPSPEITRAVRVFSEPSHTLLVTMVDVKFIKSREGAAWVARYGSPSLGRIVAALTDRVPSSDRSDGMAQIAIAGRPSTDTAIEIWGHSDHWERPGPADRRLIAATAEHTFALTANRTDDGEMEVRSAALEPVLDVCALKPGERLAARLIGKRTESGLQISVKFGAGVSTALRVVSRPSNSLLVAGADAEFMIAETRAARSWRRNLGAHEPRQVIPLRITRDGDPAVLDLPVPPAGDNALAFLFVDAAGEERLVREVRIGPEFRLVIKQSEEHGKPDPGVEVCCNTQSCRVCGGPCYTGPPHTCCGTLMQNGGTCCSVTCDMIDCYTCS